MAKKASYCAECKHWIVYDYTDYPFCMKQHKPRFYNGNPYKNDCGYKRICNDFDKKEGLE
jgi:hypothetical protein